MSNDLSSNKGPTPEDLESTTNAQACVDECHIEQLIHDTKFLRLDSLIELIKALIFQSQINDTDILAGSASIVSLSSGAGGGSGNNGSSGTAGPGGANNLMSNDGKIDYDAAVFSLEILIKVVLQNRYVIIIFK